MGTIPQRGAYLEPPVPLIMQRHVKHISFDGKLQENALKSFYRGFCSDQNLIDFTYIVFDAFMIGISGPPLID